MENKGDTGNIRDRLHPSEGEDNSRVKMELEKLFCTVDNLREAQSRLYDSISSVLCPNQKPIQEGASGAALGRVEDEAPSPLVEALIELNTQIRQITASIHDSTNRVQL